MGVCEPFTRTAKLQKYTFVMILTFRDLTSKSALGLTRSNPNRTSAAFSRHLLRYTQTSVFGIPPRQTLRCALISVGSFFLSDLPLTPCAWPTYFLIFPFFLGRVMLANCISHYSGSGCRPSMIAWHTQSLSPSLSLFMTHTHALARTNTHRSTRTKTLAPSTWMCCAMSSQLSNK